MAIKNVIDLERTYLAEMASIPIFKNGEEVKQFTLFENIERRLIKHLLSLDNFGDEMINQFISQLDTASTGDVKVNIPSRTRKNPMSRLDDIIPIIRLYEVGRKWLIQIIDLAMNAEEMQKKVSNKKYVLWRSELIKINNERMRLRTHCVNANLRLAVVIARRFARHTHHLSFLDIFQEGNIGLIKAVERFDVSRGYKFATYASWWIKSTIKRAVYDTDVTVRLPVNLHNIINKLNRAEIGFVSQYGRAPSRKELVIASELPVNRVDQAMEHRYRSFFSIDASALDGDEYMNMSFIDVLKDESIIPQDEAYFDRETEVDVSHMLMALTPRESQILRWRFGFDGEPLTLEQVSDKFSVSRERVRQIEFKAISKLRLHQKTAEYQSRAV